MATSLVLLQLSKIVTSEIQNKLIGVDDLDRDYEPLTLFILSSLPSVLNILIFNPISIIQIRLIIQEMSVVNVNDEADKERSLKTFDTISNLRKFKYNGIFDCIKKVKE